MLRRRSTLVLTSALALAVAACGQDDEPPVASPTAESPTPTLPTSSPTTTPVTASPGLTTPAPTTPDGEPPGPGPSGDHEEPEPASEPLFLDDLRVGDHDQFDRVVLDFIDLEDQLADDPDPVPRPPAYDVEVLEEHGLVRIHLTDVPAGDPGLTTRNGSGAVTAAYHATAMEGQYPAVDSWVDVFTGAPVTPEAFALRDPGRIVVDLVPAEGSWGEPVDVGDLGVLLAPEAEQTYQGELRVAGYARPFEASGPLRIEDSDGNVVHEEIYTTAAWAEAHGVFETTVDVSGFAPGEYRVVVEEVPAAEGVAPNRLESTITIE